MVQTPSKWRLPRVIRRWIGAVRPSRRPRCGLLRMTFFLNAIINPRHPEEARSAVSKDAQPCSGRVLLACSMILSFAPAILLLPSAPAQAELRETPSLVPEVASGALPPVSKRIPSEPALAELETIGRPGGELRMLMASPKDTRLMVVYG